MVRSCNGNGFEAALRIKHHVGAFDNAHFLGSPLRGTLQHAVDA
jgi:hypothetical protein